MKAIAPTTSQTMIVSWRRSGSACSAVAAAAASFGGPTVRGGRACGVEPGFLAHGPDEAKSLAGDRTDQALLLAVVAHGVAKRGDPAAQRRLRTMRPLQILASRSSCLRHGRDCRSDIAGCRTPAARRQRCRCRAAIPDARNRANDRRIYRSSSPHDPLARPPDGSSGKSQRKIKVTSKTGACTKAIVVPP